MPPKAQRRQREDQGTKSRPISISPTASRSRTRRFSTATTDDSTLTDDDVYRQLEAAQRHKQYEAQQEELGTDEEQQAIENLPEYNEQDEQAAEWNAPDNVAARFRIEWEHQLMQDREELNDYPLLRESFVPMINHAIDLLRNPDVPADASIYNARMLSESLRTAGMHIAAERNDANHVIDELRLRLSHAQSQPPAQAMNMRNPDLSTAEQIARYQNLKNQHQLHAIFQRAQYEKKIAAANAAMDQARVTIQGLLAQLKQQSTDPKLQERLENEIDDLRAQVATLEKRLESSVPTRMYANVVKSFHEAEEANNNLRAILNQRNLQPAKSADAAAATRYFNQKSRREKLIPDTSSVVQQVSSDYDLDRTPDSQKPATGDITPPNEDVPKSDQPTVAELNNEIMDNIPLTDLVAMKPKPKPAPKRQPRKQKEQKK